MGAPNAMNFGQPIVVGTLTSDPITAVNGQIYYNSTSGQFKMYQSGTWQVTGTSGSSASTTLNNLTSPTSVNQSLIPASSSGGQVLGTATNYWGPSFIQQLLDTSSVLSVDVFNRLLHDAGTHTSLDYANRLLVDSAGNTQESWSTSGVTFPQLTASTVPYLSGSKVLTSSSVTPTQLGYLSGASGTTGTGNLVFSASPTFTGTVVAAAMSLSSALNMNSNQINNLSPGIVGTDAINLNQLQNALAGTQWRPEVNLFDNVDTTLPATTATTIDGTTVTNGMRVLFVNLSAVTGFTASFANSANSITVSSNSGLYVGMLISDLTNPSYLPANTYITSIVGTTVGISSLTTHAGTTDSMSATGNNYVWNAAVSGSSITWSVADDNDRMYGYPVTGDSILVLSGTTYSESAWNYNGSAFVQFNGAGQIQPGTALSKSGNTLNVLYDNSTIQLNGSNQLYIANGSLTATQLSASANIAFSQLAALTNGNILIGSVGNVATSVAVSGDLTAINSGAFTVAKIQGTVVSGTTGTTNVVFSASPTLSGTITAAAANFSGAIGANGGITSTGALSINANSASSALNLIASSFTYGSTSTNAVTLNYVDSTTLTDNSGPTAVTAFQFATATYGSTSIDYQIKTGTATADVRRGTLRVTANASGTQVTSITDNYTESADCGVSWTASISTGTVSISYTTTNQGSNRTMRADVKLMRA